MGHFLLSAEARFSAAHTLPDVAVCERFHGHLWRVRLTVRLPEEGLAESGIGIDFRELEQIARSCVDDLEHRYLNDVPAFKDRPPSAEHIAQVVAGRARARLAQAAPRAELVEIEVWEMPEYRVVYRPT